MRSIAWRCCSNATATKCCKAADGAEAFELAPKCRPHLALLDIGMPKLDGYEVARRIRAEPWGKAHDAGGAQRLGPELGPAALTRVGFDSHLVKPASFDALAQLLSRVPPGPGGK